MRGVGRPIAPGLADLDEPRRQGQAGMPGEVRNGQDLVPEGGDEKQVHFLENAGHLAGFMEIYAKSEQTRFASGGDISLGWQTVFDRYQKKYGTRAAMGTLNFSDVEITSLAPDAALVFGHWHLQRDADAPSGLFTLVFRKTPAGWRIVHDHTSSAAKP